MLDYLMIGNGSRALRDAKLKNTHFLGKLSSHPKRYSEIFIVIGKTYLAALPDFSNFKIRVNYSSGRNLDSKAQAWVRWLTNRE